MLNNYYSKEALECLDQEDTLAVITHDINSINVAGNAISSGLVQLETQNLIEVWQDKGKVITAGSEGNCYWRKSDNWLFAAISTPLPSVKDIQGASEAAYTELIKFLHSTDYIHPIRFWNNVPSINMGDGDEELYKLFCTGRLNAFSNSNIEQHDFPAASAVGHYTEDLLVYVIASKEKATNHKNLLQVDAFQYPRQYGKSSPSFARASSITSNNEKLLFISGTASIIGHETLHEGDLYKQIEVTERNIVHLLEQTDKTVDNIKTMKVYIRHPKDLIAAKEKLDIAFPSSEKIYLHADICRSDLLIEIECYCI